MDISVAIDYTIIRKTLLLTSFCSPLTIITFIKNIYIYINSCKQFIYYEKGDFKHNERNSRKLNKYQSRISSTFSARLPLIFIHRANWLSLIKQARHRRRPTNIVFHREEGEESGSHFPEFTGKSVWKGWRLKITNGRTCIKGEKEKRRKKKKSRFTAFPSSSIRISKSKQKGDPRSWVVSNSKVKSLARPWLHVSRRKRKFTNLRQSVKACNPTLINVLRTRVGVCPTDPYASHFLSRSC